jgi:hypothetical protein
MKTVLFTLVLIFSVAARADCSAPAPVGVDVPPDRLATIAISEDFLNEQLRAHIKSDSVRDIGIKLDVDHNQILLTGVAQVPVEELRAINLEPNLGKFHFQLAIQLRVSRKGHLILEFPLNETYFYPSDSKNPTQDRVVIPVQMLSIALASARGYLAALSGDFDGFERRAKKLAAQERSVEFSIKTEKDAGLLEDLKNQKASLKLQLEAIPIERKQLQSMAKEFASILAFTGEKELNLNDELAARRNALVLKIKLSQLTPYLEGTELGGIRLKHDQKDGNGENYFMIDVNGDIQRATASITKRAPSDRPAMKTAPSLIMRLNQALLESKTVLDSEKAEMSSNMKDFNIALKDDGLHVSGSVKALLFFHFPFETIVDFSLVSPDVFDAKLREIKVAGIDFDFLAKFALESIKKRLNHSLKGICKFKYVGDEKDHTRALRVMTDPRALVPAFPDLHLVGVDVRDGEFLLKIGRP